MYPKIKIPDNIIVDLYKKIINIKKEEDYYLITYRGKMFEITDSTEIMLKIINKDKDILKQKDYFKIDFYEFATNFLKETNKYRSYHKFTIYKYNIHFEKIETFLTRKKNKTLPDYLIRFSTLLKDDKCKQFLRKKKIERLINDLDK